VRDGFFITGRYTCAYIGDIGCGGRKDVYLEIGSSNSTLIFNDGSTPEVVLDNNAALNAQPDSTPEDATRFLLSSLRRSGADLVWLTGKRTESSWL